MAKLAPSAAPSAAPGATPGATPGAAPGATPGATPGAPVLAGIDELRLACPDVEQAIIDSGMSNQLPEHWQRWLDRSNIDDISQLLRRYQSPLPSTAPGVGTLYQVAHKLNPSEPPHGWWQDFKAWLRKWLSPPGSTESSWLSRWLSNVSLPQLLMQSLLYLLMGVIVLGTLWIVWRELRLARVGTRARTGAVNRSSSLPADVPTLSLDALDRAPPREQLALLLQLLVQALLQSGRLSNDRPLTHRELAARSDVDDAGQRERFERISLLAERLLYGPLVPLVAATSTSNRAATDAMGADGVQSQVGQALADGRDLYARWLARGAPA